MSDRARRAFTLIELLVVIAIIALLVSILLPALARAREVAQSVVCLSQMRQVGVGSHNYTDSNKGFFSAGHVQVNMTANKYWVWMGQYRAQMDDATEDVFNCPAAVKDVYWEYGENPRSYAARARPGVEFDHTLTRFGYKEDEDPIEPGDFFTMGYNEAGVRQFVRLNGRHTNLGLGMHAAGSDRDREYAYDGINIASVVQPSEMIALADARADGGDDPIITGTARYPSGHPSRRHYGQSNVFFVDGHGAPERVEELLVNVTRAPFGEREYGAAKRYKTREARARRWNYDFEPYVRLW